MTAPALQRTTVAPTMTAYVAGAAATAAALVYTVADQLFFGSLDDHLHSVYDPVGKYGQPGPLYAYLYVVGILGLLAWTANILVTARRRPRARLWGWVTLGVATLPAFAPFAMTEYGSMVIPLGLAIGPAVAWAFGLIGLVLYRK